MLFRSEKTVRVSISILPSAQSKRLPLVNRAGREEIDEAPDARTSSDAKENPGINRELAITAGNSTLAPGLSACVVRALR